MALVMVAASSMRMKLVLSWVVPEMAREAQVEVRNTFEGASTWRSRTGLGWGALAVRGPTWVGVFLEQWVSESQGGRACEVQDEGRVWGGVGARRGTCRRACRKACRRLCRRMCRGARRRSCGRP